MDVTVDTSGRGLLRFVLERDVLGPVNDPEAITHPIYFGDWGDECAGSAPLHRGFVLTRDALLFGILPLVACGDDDASDADPVDTGSSDLGARTDSDMGPVDMGPVDMGPVDMGPVESCLDEATDDTVEAATELGVIDSAAGSRWTRRAATSNPSPMWTGTPSTTRTWSAATCSRVTPSPRPAGMLWELCMYYACDGDAESRFDCPTGSSPHDVGGLAGCCLVSSEGWASITLEPACAGTISEDGTAYALVSRQGGAVTCESYQLSYGDD